MNQALQELIAFLKIPSVSADPAYKAGVDQAAAWLHSKLSSLGFEAELIATSMHPIVFAQKIVNPKAPTVLVYGHYDVQPADPLELWDTPPFEPTIRDGKIFARGASDDKGQLFAHVAAVEALGDALAVNVKFIVEGEEEVGFGNLERWLEHNAERVSADALILSDSSMLAPGKPALTYALRGITQLEVRLQGANRDLHSGTYGGGAPNPIVAAVHMIAQLKNPEGHITIPHFWDDVQPLTSEERQRMAQLDFDATEFQTSIGASAMPGEPDYSVLERVTARPTLDVNGIWGGYQGEGAKTVIPSKAGFKMSMRLVPWQKPDTICQLTEQYLHSILPEGYQMDIVRLGDGKPVLTDVDSAPMQAAIKALEEVWGITPALTRMGGSVPVVAEFQKRLPNTPIVMMGFGLDDDNLHSPNEKFDIINFENAIKASKAFLQHMAK